MVVQEGGAGSSDTSGSLRSLHLSADHNTSSGSSGQPDANLFSKGSKRYTRVAMDGIEMELEQDRLIISLCCMKAVMKKMTTVQEYNNRFKGMVDQGANIGVGPPALASLLDLSIEPHTDGRKIGTADAEGSLTILGWITIPGYAGRIALVEGAAFLLLSVINMQQNGMGVHCPPNSKTCRLTVLEDGEEVEFMVLT